MLLVGVHLHDPAVAWAVVRQDFSHPKKRYRLLSHHCHVRRVSLAELERELLRIHSDRRHGGRKRLFNQDGRPAKTVRALPRIVVRAPHPAPLTAALRHRKVPVEAIFPGEGGHWLRVGGGRALGYDYRVPEGLVAAALSRVISEGRFSSGEPERPFSPGSGDPVEGLLAQGPYLRPVVAAVVWFRETVRYRRAYGA